MGGAPGGFYRDGISAQEREALEPMPYGERRRGERRSGGRRADDRRRARRNMAIAAAWAIVGAAVVLYLFFVTVGTIDPTKARAASITVLVLAVAWLAHAWRRVIIQGGYVSRPDRERRGF